MRLPDADRARVDLAKVRDYLLADDHPVGSAKAEFFARLGYGSENATMLVDVLREVARNGNARSVHVSAFGTTYVVDGMILGRMGIATPVRTVWITEHRADSPRLVTAHRTDDVRREDEHEGA